MRQAAPLYRAFVIVLGLSAVSAAARGDEIVDLRHTFPEIRPYTTPPSPPVSRSAPIPGPGRLVVRVVIAPWFRSSEPVQFRSTTPVDGRDEGAWASHLPGAIKVDSRSIPERWEDGGGLEIVTEYEVRKAQPGLEVALFPSTVRFGDGSFLQHPNSVQVVITWTGAGGAGRTGAPAKRIGYQLYFDGRLVSGPDAAGYTREQAESNCRWNRENKPTIAIRCAYEGKTFWPPTGGAAPASPAPPPPAASPAGSIAGKWRDDDGPITLEVSGSTVTGRYAFRDGRLSGTIGPANRVTGIWSQSSSANRCATERLGSFHWGRFELEFKGDRFEGKLGWCDGEIGAPWSGRRSP